MNLGQTVVAKIVSGLDVDLFSELQEDDFQAEFELPIYEFTRNYYIKYGALPPYALLTDKFKLDAQPEGDASYWLSELHKRKFLLTYDAGINNISPHLVSGNLDRARQELIGLCMRLSHMGDATSRPTELTELFHDTLGLLAGRRQAGGITGITCGFPSLSRILRGFTGKNCYVIAGRKKLGKSMIIAIMSYAAGLMGERPLMVSMEMTKEEYVNRLFALFTGIGLNYIVTGRVSTMAEAEIRRLINQLSMRYLFQEGFFKTSVNDLDLMISMYQPTIVFVDGAYLLRSPSYTNKMSGWERVSETVKEVKLIAGKHNIPIVLSYQFNKEGDVHLSDSIRQIATATMGVYIPQGRDDQRIIKIMDNRNGPTGEVTINWDFYRMNFVEVESIDDSGLNNFMGGE